MHLIKDHLQSYRQRSKQSKYVPTNRPLHGSCVLHASKLREIRLDLLLFCRSDCLERSKPRKKGDKSRDFLLQLIFLPPSSFHNSSWHPLRRNKKQRSSRKRSKLSLSIGTRILGTLFPPRILRPVTVIVTVVLILISILSRFGEIPPSLTGQILCGGG